MASLVQTPLSEVSATLEVWGAHGVTSEHLTRVRSFKDVAQRAADAMILPAGRVEKTRPIVLRNAPAEELIAAGRYDETWLDAQSFQIEGLEGEREIFLIRFEELIWAKAIDAWLKAYRFRPATGKELLALGEQHPEEQRQGNIIAPGTCCIIRTLGQAGGTGVVALAAQGSRRILGPYGYHGGQIPSSSRIAAIQLPAAA